MDGSVSGDRTPDRRWAERMVPIGELLVTLNVQVLIDASYRLPRQPHCRANVPPVFWDEVPIASGNDSMVLPAEVEEPPETIQALPGPANNIEVEEVVQNPVDEDVVQDQASPAQRQPIIMGMPPSMSQHGADVSAQEASPPAPDEPADNQEVDERKSSERQKESVAAIGPDEGPNEGVAGQESVPNTSDGRPEENHASPSTFISSLHVSSAEQRADTPSRGDVSSVSGKEQENSAGSDIVSSFAWEQEGWC
ncbi:hypothetical protein P171DRAFT_207004 [Karstenula rhodostoma CBS 690.94]|uniref:Uncharacterized protein n=1 Tax=Karstenula rhodostoma CBS 690.94 TaxID=1392251 RepID=A0A9P4PSQ7_9PLEO|nr:hypothetical protein P171DRAFT_207004 [Karstenula rhodostoma CBS 690.94]